MKVSPALSSWTASGNVMVQAPFKITSADSCEAVCFGNAVPSVPSMRLVMRTSPSFRETVFFTVRSFARQACSTRELSKVALESEFQASPGAVVLASSANATNVRKGGNHVPGDRDAEE